MELNQAFDQRQTDAESPFARFRGLMRLGKHLKEVWGESSVEPDARIAH